MELLLQSTHTHRYIQNFNKHPAAEAKANSAGGQLLKKFPTFYGTR